MNTAAAKKLAIFTRCNIAGSTWFCRHLNLDHDNLFVCTNNSFASTLTLLNLQANTNWEGGLYKVSLTADADNLYAPYWPLPMGWGGAVAFRMDNVSKSPFGFGIFFSRVRGAVTATCLGLDARHTNEWVF